MNDFARGSPQREYVIGTLVFMALYVVSIMAIRVAEGRGWLDGPGVYLAALTPSIWIAGQLGVTLRLLTRLDEYVRAVTAKRFIAAASLAFIAATTWGFLETYADVRHLPLWLVYPAFWAGFGLVSPFIRTSR